MTGDKTTETEKKEMLVVSFGTSRAASRERAVGGIERALADAFPDWEIARAFTSGRVIRRIEQEEGLKIDDPETALKRAQEEGIRQLAAVPTHVLDGEEYRKFRKLFEKYAPQFAFAACGAPLLGNADDIERVLTIIRKETGKLDDGRTEIVLVGHGTEEAANQVYEAFCRRFRETGLDHYTVGTVEASPSLMDVKREAARNGVSRIVLLPLMVVAGEHILMDIGGDQPSSWCSQLRSEGYEVMVVEKGLGELQDIQAMYIEHAGRILV